MTAAAVAERLAGLVQSVLLARVLGPTEFGAYGLLLSTVGMVAAFAGLQMGMTATVHVARHRLSDPVRAAATVGFVHRFGWFTCLALVLATVPFSSPIAKWLGGAPITIVAVAAGSFLGAVSILSGIQDGVYQGLEQFRKVSIARLVAALVTLVLVVPAAIRFGLGGVMAATVAGPLLKYVALSRSLPPQYRQIPPQSPAASAARHDLVWGFSVPAVLTSVVAGVAAWGGNLMLSRQQGGLDALAVVNVGLQWRGPVLLVTSIASSVAVPYLSRWIQQGDSQAINRTHTQLLAFNAAAATLAAVAFSLAAPVILGLYGSAFTAGETAFSLMMVSAIPQVLASVYLQQLVAAGRLWLQLLMHLWLVVPLTLGFVVLIPPLRESGLALATLGAWTAFAAALYGQRRQAQGRNRLA
jgi:O-antigen/teichoic acid export membrane protein